MGAGYTLIETPDGSPNGAIREAPAAELTLGVSVDDLADCIDPAGNLVTVIENNKPGA